MQNAPEALCDAGRVRHTALRLGGVARHPETHPGLRECAGNQQRERLHPRGELHGVERGRNAHRHHSAGDGAEVDHARERVRSVRPRGRKRRRPRLRDASGVLRGQGRRRSPTGPRGEGAQGLRGCGGYGAHEGGGCDRAFRGGGGEPELRAGARAAGRRGAMRGLRGRPSLYAPSRPLGRPRGAFLRHGGGEGREDGCAGAGRAVAPVRLGVEPPHGRVEVGARREEEGGEVGELTRRRARHAERDGEHCVGRHAHTGVGAHGGEKPLHPREGGGVGPEGLRARAAPHGGAARAGHERGGVGRRTARRRGQRGEGAAQHRGRDAQGAGADLRVPRRRRALRGGVRHEPRAPDPRGGAVLRALRVGVRGRMDQRRSPVPRGSRRTPEGVREGAVQHRRGGAHVERPRPGKGVRTRAACDGPRREPRAVPVPVAAAVPHLAGGGVRGGGGAVAGVVRGVGRGRDGRHLGARAPPREGQRRRGGGRAKRVRVEARGLDAESEGAAARGHGGHSGVAAGAATAKAPRGEPGGAASCRGVALPRAAVRCDHQSAGVAYAGTSTAMISPVPSGSAVYSTGHSSVGRKRVMVPSRGRDSSVETRPS